MPVLSILSIIGETGMRGRREGEKRSDDGRSARKESTSRASQVAQLEADNQINLHAPYKLSIRARLCNPNRGSHPCR